MKISANWLGDYLAGSYTPEQLAERITLVGLEVEEVTPQGEALNGVVVGKVLDVQTHPDADRLRVCTVDIGGEVSQIVCGAPNVAAGQTVAVATVGSVLPLLDKNGNRLEIKRAKIRGVESAGMICAEDELGLGGDHSGILVLDGALSVGTPIDDALGRRPDSSLEISLTPNRPDAACHFGVARDLSAAFDAALRDPRRADLPLPDGTPLPKLDVQAVPSHPDMAIDILNPELCNRYVGVLIDGVTIAPSPQWLQDRMKAIGLRPLNNVVDATNYVLHELGQPLHAFDFEQLAGRRIVVRSYDEATEFTTLDGQGRKVPAGSLFICDGEKPVALAGIMGGLNSEVTGATTRVLLESAWFNPVSIRKTSKALALQTDASYRFERGVDPLLAKDAAIRCARLIAALAGGTVDSRILDVHPIQFAEIEVPLRHRRLVSLIGHDPGQAEIERILTRLGFGVKPASGDSWLVQVPSWRPDVAREVDLIEEVARIFDYNRIPAPERVAYVKPSPFSPWEPFVRKVRSLCTMMGFREIYTISLLPDPMATQFAPAEDQVRTLNPISQDQAVLRPDLRYGFLRTAAYNFNRGVPGVALFEIGNIFSRNGKSTWVPGVREEVHLLMGVAGVREQASWRSAEALWTSFDLKACAERFLASLGLQGKALTVETEADQMTWNWNGKAIARLEAASGALRKSFDLKGLAWTVEFNLSAMEPAVTARGTTVFESIPKFPSIEYDAAFVVDATVSSLDIETEIRRQAGGNLRQLSVFDVFEGPSLGEGKKSVAYRMSFMDKTKTLTISDVEPIIKKIVNRLDQRFSAKLRA